MIRDRQAQDDPVLVAEPDGPVAGHAICGRFRDKDGYDLTVGPYRPTARYGG